MIASEVHGSTPFSPEQMAKLESIMYPKQVEKGCRLFWEGDKAGQLYYIHSGRIKLKKTTALGRDLILSIAQKGDWIGEFCCGPDSFCTYGAEVLEDAHVGIVQQSDLEILFQQHGDLSICFMRWQGINQMKLQTKLRDLLLYGKPGALASTLIRMCNTFGIACKDGILLDVQVNHTELADMIGSTRENVNRLLNSWKKEGIISVTDGRIVVHDLDALRSICQCPLYPTCPSEICRL